VKKTLSLIIGVFFSGFAIGQANPSSNVVNLKVPERAVKLSTDDVQTFIKANGFKHSQLAFEKRRKFYEVDGLIISFWDIPMNPTHKRSLQKMQDEGLGILKDDKENIIKFSKIESINNIQFLIYEYQKEDEVFLRFISDENNNKNLTGILEFKTSDEKKAEAVLQEFLQSMHFKQ
jgi:hypothetical protein